MPPPIERQRAFTLIEAAVAIAIIAILAGAIAPLALKALNQQREFKTREGLKAAFEGMFGARDRRVANMRADFGYDPTLSSDLSGLFSSPVSGLRAYLPDPTDAGGMYWGYNGPYWSGTTDASSRPLDAWGRPMRLRVANASPNHTWQVQSFGPNGLDEAGSGDDLIYPTLAAKALSYRAVLYLNIANSTPPTSGAITVKARNGTTTLALLVNGLPYSGATIPTVICSPTAGGVYINITRTGTGATPLTFVVDLLPGEVRSFQVTL